MSELRVLASLFRGMPRRERLADRLQAFYAPQADRYDAFRERLLQGRDVLARELRVRPGSRLVELGAGTGRTLDYFGEAGRRCASVELVDLCPALLAKARERTRERENVRVVEADATTYVPAVAPDVIVFSYSLSMMPAWEHALDHACSMLAPGGRIGIVDFFAARGRHGRIASAFWRRWFAHDGVRVDDLTPRAARARVIETFHLERSTVVPYMGGLRVPYFVFVGRRPAD